MFKRPILQAILLKYQSPIMFMLAVYGLLLYACFKLWTCLIDIEHELIVTLLKFH